MDISEKESKICSLRTFAGTFLGLFAVLRLTCFSVLCSGTPLVLAFVGFYSAHNLQRTKLSQLKLKVASCTNRKKINKFVQITKRRLRAALFYA